MDKHFCEEHQTDYFKTAKMRGYAHPIGDTGKWCNEGDAETYHNPYPDKPSPQEGEEPLPKTKSQEIAEHVWWKELGNRIGDGSIEKDYPNKAVKIKHDYYKKMSEITGVDFHQ